MFAGLLAIIPPGITAGEPGSTGPSASSNFVAFSITGCTYTVDWGNGATQSYAAGATAQYQFLYEGISASTTITDDVGLSGCRQTVITAYPTVAGTTFSGMNFGGVYSQAGYTFPANTASPWLDMRFAGSTINSFNLGYGSTRSVDRSLRTLRQFEWVGNSAITDGVGLFTGLVNLRSIKGTSWTANITDFNNMFFNCRSLQTVPLLNTANGVTFAFMFDTCSSLQTVPLFDTGNGIHFGSMFLGCSSLQTVPLLNTSKATFLSSMFRNCSSLQTVPLFDTGNVQNFGNMLEGCRLLQTVPLFDTKNATSFGSMFLNCSSLQTVPLLNTSKATTFSNMFQNCSSLQTVPLFDTASVSNFSISNMFNGCSSLQAIPLFNFTRASLASTPFSGCSNLKQAATLAPLVSWDVSSLNLSPEAINQVFAALPTGAAFAKTCTITNNWGEPFCNRSIATAKGWLVQPIR